MTSQSPQPLTEEEREEIRDRLKDVVENGIVVPRYVSISAACQDAAKLLAELDRLRSWDGLMELLDEKWPEDIFPTLMDDTARDPGPRILSLLRWTIRLRRELAELEAEVSRLRAENTALAGQIAAARKAVDNAMLEAAGVAHGRVVTAIGAALEILGVGDGEEQR